MNNRFDSLAINAHKTYKDWSRDKLLISDKPKVSSTFNKWGITNI